MAVICLDSEIHPLFSAQNLSVERTRIYTKPDSISVSNQPLAAHTFSFSINIFRIGVMRAQALTPDVVGDLEMCNVSERFQQFELVHPFRV